MEPPLWLCDEGVRAGIKALLELDRCKEEEERLLGECRAMREWFSEEWKVVNMAMNLTGKASFLII